jgi:P-type Cu+ transporter
VTDAGVAADGQVEAELVVTGMTCGACAARIERRLNRLDGVAATSAALATAARPN